MGLSTCRDCRTCTHRGITRLSQDWLVGLGYLLTVGIAWAVKRAGWRHCPQCKHLLRRHLRREDGSFRD